LEVEAEELVPQPRTKFVRRRRDSPIEQWIRTTEKLIKSMANANALFSLLKDILCSEEKVAADGRELIFLLEDLSKNGDHPSMNTNRDVDYAAIYQALADYMRGEIPKQMNPASRQVF
jgi:hypothetical protein